MALGRAFIEIHADTKPFKKELLEEVLLAVQVIERSIRPLSVKIGTQVADGVGEGIAKKAGGIGRKIKEEVEKTKPRVNVDVDVDRGRIRRFFSNLVEQFQDIGARLGPAINKVLGPFSDLIANLFNVPAGSPLAAILTALAFVVLPALLPLLIAVAGAVSNLVGLLALVPAGLSFILAVVAPLIIAFHNLSDVFDLIFEKDPEKLKEGLKGLSPALQTLTGILRTFAPAFTAIANLVQKSLFEPINQILTPVLKALLPLLSGGFATIAAQVGALFAQIGTFLASPLFRDFLTKLFPSIGRILQTISPAIIHLLSAFTDAAEAGLPALEQVFRGLAGFLNRFADFIEKSVRDGSFQDWLTKAFDTFQDISGLIQAILGFLGTLFAQTEDEGGSIIEIFTKFFKDATDFFNSPDGRDLLENLADLAVVFTDNLRAMLPVLALMLLPFIAVSKIINEIIFGLRKIIELITNAKNLLGGLGSGIGGLAAAAARAAIPHFAQGGIVTRPTILQGGERGPEAIIPLNNPRRAAEVMRQAGLSTGATNVTVWLGTTQIIDILDTRIDRGFQDLSRDLARGPRGD